MTAITLATQTMFAELQQRCMDAEFDETFDERGVFVRKRVKGRQYWYFQRTIESKAHRQYVGPVDDLAITERVEQFGKLKSDYKQRREMVRALLAVGLPEPDAMSGRVIEAFSREGFFRLRGVLIGTVAFQTYAALLGTKLASATMMTQDVDFAQFYDISKMVDDSLPPIMELLWKIDPTFKPIPHPFDPARVTRFSTTQGYAVDFLTPNRGSDDHSDKPVEMPALGGASATTLRYLDFLIFEPIRAVLLHNGGIPVAVPAPERYAVHKLIVATLREENPLKSPKDIAQASALIEALAQRRPVQLADSFREALARGPKWQQHLKAGLTRVNPSVGDLLLKAADMKRNFMTTANLEFDGLKDTAAVAFDSSRDVVVFFGMDRGHRVKCGVSVESLEDHFKPDGASTAEYMKAFQRNRDTIQILARERYLNGNVEPGTVLLRTAEIQEMKSLQKAKRRWSNS